MAKETKMTRATYAVCPRCGLTANMVSNLTITVDAKVYPYSLGDVHIAIECPVCLGSELVHSEMFQCDPEIAEYVAWLNVNGYPTKASCAGHVHEREVPAYAARTDEFDMNGRTMTRRWLERVGYWNTDRPYILFYEGMCLDAKKLLLKAFYEVSPNDPDGPAPKIDLVREDGTRLPVTRDDVDAWIHGEPGSDHDLAAVTPKISYGHLDPRGVAEAIRTFPDFLKVLVVGLSLNMKVDPKYQTV